MSLREAEHLIQDLFDNRISEDDFSRLEIALAESAQLRAVFRDLSLLESCLQQHADQYRFADGRGPVPIEMILRRRQRRAVRVSLLAAAALLAITAIVLRLVLAPDRVPAYALHDAPDSIFSVSHDTSLANAPEGDQLAKGSTLHLVQGTIEFQLRNGAKVILSGPSKLRLMSDRHLHLTEGTLWARAPKKAAGFTISTPRLRAVDLGTEFGIISIPGATDEVHVFEGKVQLTALRGRKESAVLSEDQARQVTGLGSLREIPQDPFAFHRSLPAGIPYFHFGFDSVPDDTTPVDGVHPGLEEVAATLVQSDRRAASERLVEGAIGNALHFDGRGDFVKTNWPGVYGTKPLTIACWVKSARESTYGGWVAWGAGKLDSRMPHQWKVLLTPPIGKDGQRLFRCAWGQRDELSCNVDIPNDEWHHFAVVFSGGSPDSGTTELRFYLDGKRIQPRHDRMPNPPKRPSDFLESQPLVIGDGLREVTDPKQRFFEGFLDELFIFEGALSSRQIDLLYRENRYAPGE